MRCIDCEHCDARALKCRPETREFAKEYDLMGDDIRNECWCDYFKPIKVKIKIKNRLTNGK